MFFSMSRPSKASEVASSSSSRALRFAGAFDAAVAALAPAVVMTCVCCFSSSAFALPRVIRFGGLAGGALGMLNRMLH